MSRPITPPDYWWTNGGGSFAFAFIGKTTVGSVTVDSGSDLSSGFSYIGYEAGATGEVTVDGSGSTWTNIFFDLDVGVSGQGTLNITNGGAVSNGNGFICESPGSTGVVTVDGNGSTWANSSCLSVGDSGQGTLNITNGGAVSNNYNGYIGYGDDSTGVVTVDGSGSTWTNSNSLYVGGSDYSSGGTGELSVGNGGSVAVGNMLKVWNPGTVNLAGGALTAVTLDHTDGGAFNFTGGLLSVGTFQGNLVNNGGTISPGSSPGLMTVTGDLTMSSGNILIELAGTARGTDYDAIDVTGALTLAGTLNVVLYGEFMPEYYDEFEILTAGTVSGVFDLITGGGLIAPNKYLVTVYNADNVTLVAALPGDATLDRSVDVGDLGILAGNYGAVGGQTWATGDFNGDGNVDVGDLGILAGNYGTSVPLGPIPEPATLSLLALGGLAILKRKRR